MARGEGGPTAQVQTRLRRIALVANPASGSVGPGAADEAAALISSLGCAVEVAAPEPEGLGAALHAAVAKKPDILVVLAGDGTARAAATLCGLDGPLLAPLPGGTMNVLPHALYGDVPWQAALTLALTEGVEHPVGGGEIDGEFFYVAAILGQPTLLARAREAARGGQFWLAMTRARRAMRGAFSQRLRFALDGGEVERTEVLSFICPLVSRSITYESALEAATISPTQAGELVRLGFRALVGGALRGAAGDWRDDPSVSVGCCQTARVWGRRSIPATLDGEPVRLGHETAVRFHKIAFRALAPVPAPGTAA